MRIRSKYALLALVVPLLMALCGVALAFSTSSPSAFFGVLIAAAVASALSGLALAAASVLRREPLWPLALLAACISLAPGALVAVGMAEYPQRV